MGITGAALAAAAATTAYQATETRKARKQAASDAAAERDQLAAMQAAADKKIPTANDADVRRARRRSIAQLAQRRGRSSTILTGGESASALGG